MRRIEINDRCNYPPPKRLVGEGHGSPPPRRSSARLKRSSHPPPNAYRSDQPTCSCFTTRITNFAALVTYICSSRRSPVSHQDAHWPQQYRRGHHTLCLYIGEHEEQNTGCLKKYDMFVNTNKCHHTSLGTTRHTNNVPSQLYVSLAITYLP